MLRSLVLALLIVNLGFFAWTHGWLKAWAGMPAEGQREPQRLSAQLHAEQIEVLQPGDTAQNHALRRRTPPAEAASTPDSAASAAEATSAASSATAQQAAATPALCVEAGPFNPEDAAAVDKTLRPLLQTGSWTRQSIAIGGQWMVYMGPYNDEELYDRKVTELKRIKGLNFDEVRNGTYARGLSLGRFASEADAETRLGGLKQRGIRTARVVTIRPAGQVHYLRVAQANESMQVTLSGLKLPQGKSFTACRS
ncbi:hypothetical protein [Aquabacterium parvum]|uniref:hypothetical protein n=1 Tax=Aquabacterium parvum TaxID=70584 RepID=UPI000718DBEB|nr:hypothetical protein [Aquabacterium parvum]